MLRQNTKRQLCWTFYDRIKVGIDSKTAYSEVKRMNQHYKREEKRNPYILPLKATVNLLPYGMAEILIWYGR